MPQELVELSFLQLRQLRFRGFTWIKLVNGKKKRITNKDLFLKKEDFPKIDKVLIEKYLEKGVKEGLTKEEQYYLQKLLVLQRQKLQLVK
jgi:hypothetical protein